MNINAEYVPDSNEQLKLALDFVRDTGHNIFLTGKAGTGKTTFLHFIKANLPKRMVVVAPTGVAAINAGGVTIHSFFQLAFAPFIPGVSLGESRTAVRKFRREKVRLIQSLDLLIIDEISMVRADLLDAIDDVLKRFRHSSKPFGGVQLLMIGDLHQLAPVIKDDEWQMLSPYYETVFFFSSRALMKTNTISIELNQIFRQSDAVFIDLLEQIRTRNITPAVLQMLNSRCLPDFIPDEEDGYITLTTHNAHASEMNQSRLAVIDGESRTFTAIVQDDFPSYAFPTDTDLKLKVGAQVMFVKNDLSADKAFYNGKIGRIIEMGEDYVLVRCPGDLQPIEVRPLAWESLRYELNELTREINETVTGVFIQLPLRLAWAITIHKSQGLTFDKAIIDARASFAHGQVYVALSRCRTFEGIILRSEVLPKSVITDSSISLFTEDVKNNQPDQMVLHQARLLFQQDLLNAVFNFTSVQRLMDRCLRIAQENASSLDVSVEKAWSDLIRDYTKQLFEVSRRFEKQLLELFQVEEIPEESARLNDRVAKAATYFADQCQDVYRFCSEFDFDTDNMLVRSDFDEAIDKLRRDAFIRRQCLDSMVNGFVPQDLILARTNAELDYKPAVRNAKREKGAPKATQNPELYKALKAWRDELAKGSDTEEHKVLPYKTLVEISNKLPLSEGELKKIKGIGKMRAAFFADDILEITRSYCVQNNLRIDFDPDDPKNQTKPKTKPEKRSSEQITFELFEQGQSVEDIAVFRGMSPSTISGHMCRLIAKGLVKAIELISIDKAEQIAECIHRIKKGSLSDVKAALGDEYSYDEIKYVLEEEKFKTKD